MSFIHLMLNELDMKEKGYDAGIVLEGEARKLIQELENQNKTTVCRDMDGHPSMTKYIDQGYEIITI